MGRQSALASTLRIRAGAHSKKVHRIADRRFEPGHAGRLALVQDAIRLDAERVHAENHRLTVVVEGVEQDFDVVVRGDFVAVARVACTALAGSKARTPK